MRYCTSRFGRWLSADWSSVPVPVPYANLTNPQTLNLYSMVADDPESFADLDGHVQNASQGLSQPGDSGGPTCAATGQGGTGSANSGTCGAAQTANQTDDQQQAEAAKEQAKQQKPSILQRLKQWVVGSTPAAAAGAVRQAPGANPAAQAAKAAARQTLKQVGPRGPQPPSGTTWPTEPAPTEVPGSNSPGVPIGTTPGTKLPVNTENMSNAQKIIYIGAQALRALGGIVKDTMSDVLIIANPTPPRICQACPGPG